MSGIAGSPFLRHLALGAALILAALPLAGCIVHHHHDAPVPEAHPAQPARHGPPPHAPAHGYRKKHPRDGVDLAYDSEVGVYVVLGRPSVYWDGERYLRWSRVGWQVTARLDGVWVSVSADAVPSSLKSRHGAAAKAPRPGHGPAKRAD
jgi:hypothetical protein